MIGVLCCEVSTIPLEHNSKCRPTHCQEKRNSDSELFPNDTFYVFIYKTFIIKTVCK